MKTFFKEFNAINKNFYNHNGKKTTSVDGSGIDPSVGIKSAKIILNWIKEKYPKTKTLIDLGAGKGYIQKYSSEYNIDGYSFEGSATLINKVVCNKNKFCIIDLTKEIKDKRLFKAFDITTSFELIEHIPEEDQITFWKNVKFLTNICICSIHRGKKEHETKNHVLLREENWWNNFFKLNNINYTFIGNKFSQLGQQTRRKWGSSLFYIIEF
jgi:2-polyprenyl-3-methyl-5-hydroxy-6-metoxy-1,4-benzoquinol methylase